VLANNETRRRWTRPRVECLESRPEVTAYSGVGDGGGPWLTNGVTSGLTSGLANR
jgi:hypothetical protein